MTKLGLKTGSVSFHSGPVAPRPSPPLVSTGHGSARQQPWPGPLALCWPPVCGSPGTHAGGIPTDSLRKHRAQRDRPPPAGHPRPSYQRAVCTSHACPSSAALRVRTCSFCLWQVSFEQLLSRGHFFNQPPPPTISRDVIRTQKKTDMAHGSSQEEGARCVHGEGSYFLLPSIRPRFCCTGIF